MHNKIKITFFLLVFFMFFVFAPANYSMATNEEAIGTIVTQIEDLYNYSDSTDLNPVYKNHNMPALAAAQQVLDGLESADLQPIADPLLTQQVIDQYNAYDPSLYDKDRWTDFIAALFAFTYFADQDSSKLKTDIENFYGLYSNDFKALFGPDITMDDLAALLTDTRANIKDQISLSEASTLANGANADMYRTMIEVLYNSLDAAAKNNDHFTNKLDDLGWEKGKLIESVEALSDLIDSDGEAQRALALIAMRSETNPMDNDVLGVGETPTYTVTIMGYDASSTGDLVGWYSMNDSVVKVTEKTTGGFEIKAVGRGETELLAYRNYADADPEIDWLARLNVSVTQLSSGGGGGGGGAVTPTVAGVEIKSAPDKLVYTEGDALDLTGLQVTLTYSNGNKKYAALNEFDENDITVSPKDGDVLDAADTEIVITVNGKTVKQPITVKKDTTVTPPVKEPVLTDIDGHWAQDNIEYLVGIGAIAGYPDATFRPDTLITRAEFAKMIVDSFELTAESGKIWEDTANHWAKDYIATAAASGIVLGYNDHEFGPDDLITREQMAIIIVKAAGLKDVAGQLSYSDKADVSSWAYNWVVSATQNKIMSGNTDNTFKPLKNATRAEAATVIYNVLMK